MGVAFAESLAAAGMRVVLAARRKDKLEEVAGRIRTNGGQALAVACDVADQEQIEELRRRSEAEFGTVDLLVNNAGFTTVVPAEDQTPEDFRAHMDVNLTGAFFACQIFGRPMLERQRGNIVNVASMLGFVGSGQVKQAGYAASKGGMVNLTRELGAQWARRGVRVNAIAPGWFPTEMTGDMFGDDRSMKWLGGRTPMGRGGNLQELVGPLLFLASEASSFMTGHILTVDGGWTIV